MTQFIIHCTEHQCLTSVAEVGHFHIRAWVVSLMDAGQSPRSINRKLSCLKTYFRFLKKRGHIQKDPMQKIVAPKVGKRLPVYLQESQMTALFSHVEFPDHYAGQMHRLILEMLYATGMRRSELSNLKINDIDFERMVFRVKGKGDKMRIAPFAPYLYTQLEHFIQLRKNTFPSNAEPWLLLNSKGEQFSPSSIYQVVHKYLSLVSSAEQRSPHVIRHSFATHLSNAGAELNVIKELLGHSNLAATQIYMHNSVERLLKVYEQAHPKGEEENE